jgi:hypothetical protein
MQVEGFPQTMKPGDRINLYAQNKEGNEIEIKTSDGLVVRFNLAIGNCCNVVVGEESLTINLNPYNKILVGVPEC